LGASAGAAFAGGATFVAGAFAGGDPSSAYEGTANNDKIRILIHRILMMISFD
jgi:hypothetical protein